MLPDGMSSRVGALTEPLPTASTRCGSAPAGVDALS